MGKYKKLYEILKCPINIPINDLDAWQRYPKYRWIYNKILLCEFQNIKCAPMPILPTKFPVILKPITNLYGMGLNMAKINNKEEFYEHWYSNNFWMEFFEGEQLSYDIIVLKGKIKFYTCYLGDKDKKTIGKFQSWESVERELPDIVKQLIDQKLKDYSGVINVETIDGNIIEAHLRMGELDQFPTFDILKGLIATYQEKEYDWDIKLDKVYFFPVWSRDHKGEDVTEYLRKEIVPMLEKNKYIYDFEIDNPHLATPCDERRLMWFTCGHKEYGESVRESITNKIKDEF